MPHPSNKQAEHFSDDVSDILSRNERLKRKRSQESLDSSRHSGDSTDSQGGDCDIESFDVISEEECSGLSVQAIDNLIRKLQQQLGRDLTLKQQDYLRTKLSPDYAYKGERHRVKQAALILLLTNISERDANADLFGKELVQQHMWDRIRDEVGQHTSGSWGAASGAEDVFIASKNRLDLQQVKAKLELSSAQEEYLLKRLNAVNQKQDKLACKKQHDLRIAMQLLTHANDGHKLAFAKQSLWCAVCLHVNAEKSGPTTGKKLFDSLLGESSRPVASGAFFLKSRTQVESEEDSSAEPLGVGNEIISSERFFTP